MPWVAVRFVLVVMVILFVKVAVIGSPLCFALVLSSFFLIIIRIIFLTEIGII